MSKVIIDRIIMARIKDIFSVILILSGFLYVLIQPITSYRLNDIKQNWAKYRCNPLVMPFASRFGHDEEENFTYCVQNMQTNYMSYILEPTKYATSVLSSGLSSIINDINFIRMKISSLVGNIFSIIGSIFSVFVNILIHFQVMMIKLKDTFGKLVGVMMTSVYLIIGSIYTGTSITGGPIGQTISQLEAL